MRILIWVSRIAVFMVLFGFVLKNSGPVIVRMYGMSDLEASLAVVILAAFAAGAAIGVVAGLPAKIRLRNEIRGLRADPRFRPQDAAAPDSDS